MKQSKPELPFSVVADVRKALEAYRDEVDSTPMADNTKKTYLLHSTNFVRWLEGDFTPGARLK